VLLRTRNEDCQNPATRILHYVHPLRIYLPSKGEGKTQTGLGFTAYRAITCHERPWSKTEAIANSCFSVSAGR
jgi:hypothetical protein